jgi:hypothetical protein
MAKNIGKIIIACFVIFFVLLNGNLAYADNSLPVASSADINDGDNSVSLSEGNTTDVTVTATVTDEDGCEDIDSVSVKFFRTDVGASADDDANNHYTHVATLNSGTCEGGSDLSSTWTAVIPVAYYADPTDAGSAHESTNWTAKVIPSDKTETGTDGTDTIEMETLTALNITSTIVFGKMDLGADTGTVDKTATVTNTGNKSIGVQVDGYGKNDDDGKSMDCTTGSIPIENEKYSKTAETAYASKTALTDTAATISDFSVAQRTSGVSTGVLYWGMGMPINGVGGNCSGIIAFTAL